MTTQKFVLAGGNYHDFGACQLRASKDIPGNLP
jgi:hypothetical protein